MDQVRTWVSKRLGKCNVKRIHIIQNDTPGVTTRNRRSGEIDRFRYSWLSAGRVIGGIVKNQMNQV